MGKWSPEYHDDVLASKMKGLVQGAITRLKLEKQEPIISYESFIQELDTGDSFTTSIIDILVREIADRRNRTNATDRRLIADKTAKNLKLLATPLRVYRDSTAGVRHHGRRGVHLTDYLSVPPDEMEMDDDDDEFESMLEGAMEGSRMNPELYDAIGGTHNWTHTEPRRLARSYSAVLSRSEEASPLILPSLPSPPSFPSRPSAWGMPLVSTSSLPRASSMRRPTRSRTGDFSEFTSRRRSTTREALGSRSDADNANDSQAHEFGSSRTSQSGARRFFPFSRTRRNESSATSPSHFEVEDNAEASRYSVEFGGTADPSPSSPAWFSIPTPIASTSSQHDGNDSEHREDEAVPSTTPRLRRGGLRAPESLLTRHASPITLLNPVNVRISASQTYSRLYGQRNRSLSIFLSRHMHIDQKPYVCRFGLSPVVLPLAYAAYLYYVHVWVLFFSNVTFWKGYIRPQARVRELSSTPDEPEAENEEERNLPLAELIELRKLRKAREGIDVAKLHKGDAKKKKKRVVPEEEVGGLKQGAAVDAEDEDEEAIKEARTRRVVRANNFTQQTNALDVDKHMMAYIEENLKIRSRPRDDETQKKPADPQDQLYEIVDRWKVEKHNPAPDEGSVTNSLTMLTAIPEVDLGMDARLKNIEETEKAKRIVAEERQERKRQQNGEEHLVASRFYRPNLKQKSDAEIMREAKLEAMGLPSQEDQPRKPQHERPQMATDEIVMERFKKRMRK